MLSFDSKTAAPPRDASTVIILRDAERGIEAFFVRRHKASGFMGGALVFPGGKVDASDGDAAWGSHTTGVHPRTAVFATESAPARSLAIAACRETFEEGGILPLARGVVADLPAESRKRPLLELVRERSLMLALDGLVPWARWVTPEAEARRFDARFFLLRAPDGQVGKHDERETTESFWAAPAAVLQETAMGKHFLAPPTARTLELLANVESVEAAFAVAARQTLEPICPLFVPDERAPFLALPGDPAHEIKDKRVDGPTRYVIRDGRFSSEDPS